MSGTAGVPNGQQGRVSPSTIKTPISARDARKVASLLKRINSRSTVSGPPSKASRPSGRSIYAGKEVHIEAPRGADGILSGEGSMFVNGQEIFRGTIEKGAPKFGLTLVDNGNTFEGPVNRDAQPNGKGVLYYENGSQFEGMVSKEGKPVGKGTLTLKNGSSFPVEGNNINNFVEG